MGDSRSSNQRYARPAAILGAVLMLGLLIVIFVRARVCDEQLSSLGEPVDVCRHVQVTDPPVAVVGIVLLGLIAVALPIAEVSAFGISLKQRITEAKEAAQAAEEAAKSAQLAAEKATETSQLADSVSKHARDAAANAVKTSAAAEEAAASATMSSQVLEQLLLAQEPHQGRTATDLSDALAALASEYDEIRSSEGSSDSRTARLTKKVAAMVAAVTSAGRTDFDGRTALSAPDMGLRVAGYAYYYAITDPNAVPLLVDAVLAEPPDHRFGQYWGLRAIRRQVHLEPDALDENSRKRLRSLLRSVGSGTDRAYELREILRISPGKHAS